MSRSIAGIVGALALLVAGCAGMGSGGWVTLLDGETGMENWNVTGGGNWRAEDGSIQADKSTTKGASILVSKRSFKDFELYVEFWAADETNSGVYLRAMNPNDVRTATGAYEAQIWDRNPDPKYATGALVNVAAVPVPPIYKAGGHWNVYEIRAKGPEITLKLNGVQTAKANDGRFPEGRIGLQFNPNSGPIKFRKVRIREL
jgi:hypothetical protein